MPQGHRGPCCPHGTSLMILPWDVPPHTVSSREEVPTQKCAAGVLSSSWWQRRRSLAPMAQGQVGLLPHGTVQKPAPQNRWNEYKLQTKGGPGSTCRKQPQGEGRGREGPGGAGPGKGSLAGGHISLEQGALATGEPGTTKALSWIESWSPKDGSPSCPLAPTNATWLGNGVFVAVIS